MALPISSSPSSRNGAVKRKDSRSSGRTYETPDGVFPSVTSILSVISKPALVNWSAKVERELVCEVAYQLYEDAPVAPRMARLAYMTTLNQRIGTTKAHERVSQKALDAGSAAHSLIEWNLRRELGQKVGPEPRVSGESANAFAQYEAWRASVDLKPMAIEQTIWHSHDRYAGTLDLLARVDGRIAVIDFKTSSGIYDEYYLQVAAYGIALNWMGHGPAECGYIVRLPKRVDDGFQVEEVNDFPTHYATFLHAVSLYNWQAAKRAEWEARKASAAA